MRIGLYGLPTAGKSFILSAVRSLEVLSGSFLLKELAPNFHELSDSDKAKVRERLALELKKKDEFIMDGHYSFGDAVVFTEEDGQLYDAFLYLCVDPKIISNRMAYSFRNQKYLQYDIEKWQRFEIESLRAYCHNNNKDFYVIDNPREGFFSDISVILDFIDSIVQGYSCVIYARKVTDSISDGDIISLIDGDKTFIKEDSSGLLGYKTHLFDGNYYTGFQAWRHDCEMTDYLRSIGYSVQSIDDLKITLNETIKEKAEGTSIILTSGHPDTWKQISDKYGMPLFYGNQMCSDTKYFITKFLQDRGCKIIAFGDSMNDYYMLKQADTAYLVLKNDGSVSSSLRGRNLEGIIRV